MLLWKMQALYWSVYIAVWPGRHIKSSCFAIHLGSSKASAETRAAVLGAKKAVGQ